MVKLFGGLYRRVVLPQKEYKLSPNVQIECHGITPQRQYAGLPAVQTGVGTNKVQEGQFIITFDKNGRLDLRGLSSVPTIKVTAGGETRNIRIDLSGWAEIIKD